MKICLNCKDKIPAYQEVNGQLKQLTSRSYCLACSPFGKRNTRRIHIKRVRPSTKHCADCGRTFNWTKNSVCSTCRTFKRREQQRAIAIDYCGGKCSNCKNDDYDVLTFHHRDPKEKKFNLCNSWQKKWEVLKEEIEKCDLMCANCHMKLHRKEKF
jgi:hypothetical protein